MEKKTNLDKLLYIIDRIGPDEVLAQLAEEAAELAQAALKYRRTLTGKNPTPVSCGDALKRLQEEHGDVTIAYRALMVVVIALSGNEVPSACLNMPGEMQQKLDRWGGKAGGDGGAIMSTLGGYVASEENLDGNKWLSDDAFAFYTANVLARLYLGHECDDLDAADFAARKQVEEAENA